MLKIYRKWLKRVAKRDIIHYNIMKDNKNIDVNPLKVKGLENTQNVADKPTLHDWKVSKIMCKAAEVGKIVVNKCLDRGLFINTQKLQKLLVLMQVDCIRRSGKPLFKEDIRVWDCGVAIKEVNDEFSLYGEGFCDKQIEYISLLEAEEQSVNHILNEHGNKDALLLNETSDAQKVIKLSVPSNNTGVPHLCYQIMIGAFLNE